MNSETIQSISRLSLQHELMKSLVLGCTWRSPSADGSAIIIRNGKSKSHLYRIYCIYTTYYTFIYMTTVYIVHVHSIFNMYTSLDKLYHSHKIPFGGRTPICPQVRMSNMRLPKELAKTKQIARVGRSATLTSFDEKKKVNAVSGHNKLYP